MTVVPVMRPRIADVDAVAPYLRQMDACRVYTNFGPLADELERRYAKRLNVAAEQVVACANATLGLQGAAAISDAVKFHCPAWTFPATPSAIIGSGAAVGFHDVDESDWQIVAPAPVAGEGLMPVLPFGAEFDSTRWRDWDEVVIDAAASGGAEDLDLSWLPRTWSAAISLHATKVLGAGEGAIMVFGDPDRARRFREYTVLGFADRRESDFVGTNAKLSEVAAAYALAALDHWDVELAQWRRGRELTRSAEVALGISSICADYPGVTPYWIVAFASTHMRTACVAALDRAGVGSRQWWPTPCPAMAAFAHVGEDGCFPQSERLSSTTLGLPFFRDIESTDVDRVIDALEPTVARFR